MTPCPSIHWPANPLPRTCLADIGTLRDAYFSHKPDITDTTQRVSFGTSGHRGSSLRGTFNEAHVLAISQAICEYRGEPWHQRSALPRQGHARAVRAGLRLGPRGAGGQRRRRSWSTADDGYTPTPAISHAILTYNRGRTTGLADGIVITPSHNPPEDGGFKYNPPHGGPADTDITRWIEDRANQLLADDLKAVKRMAYEAARRAAHAYDYVGTYVDDLGIGGRHGRDPRRPTQDRRRSAGRRGRSPTGSRSSSATGSKSKS